MSIDVISNPIYGQESYPSAQCARLTKGEWLGREPRAVKPNCLEGRNWRFGPRNSNHDSFFDPSFLPLCLPAVCPLLKSVSRAVCLFEPCARLVHRVSEYTSRREFGQSSNMDFPSHPTFRVCNQPPYSRPTSPLNLPSHECIQRLLLRHDLMERKLVRLSMILLGAS